MGNKKIYEYADFSINPLRVKGGGWHCTKVSTGCQNCWAEGYNNRFGNKMPFDDRDVEFELDLQRFNMLPHASMNRPKTIAVQYMGDMFHGCVKITQIGAIWKTIWAIYEHRFLCLTKRIDNAAETYKNCDIAPPPNLWLGTSVENQETYDDRASKLSQIPAAKRWVSIEPMLEDVDLGLDSGHESGGPQGWIPGVNPDWIVVGCESGPKRRPCDPEWIRSVVKQCQAASVACFVKQVEINGRVSRNPEEWPEWLRVREYPK